MSNSSKDLIDRALKATQENEINRQKDPFRLNYHLMPPVGLLNDPNGFVYFQGRYHLFYQWNPFETKHGSKFWGHYSSSDLAVWQAEPMALVPSDPFDKNGCYSGSAIEHNGELYLFYTGNVKNERGERETYQCLAVSEDGLHFDKKGPVVYLPEGFTAHFRDPKVWKENNQWFMVIGAQDEKEQGCAVLYTSENLYDWGYEGIIAGSHRQSLGYFGYMWECPDLFTLQDTDILLVCPQGLDAKGFKYNNVFQSGYFSGHFDPKQVTFTHTDFHELDHGFDFYAPQTTVDAKGRRLLFAWMGITDESEPYHPTIKYNWVHAMTLPRELVYKEGFIHQRPVEELKRLRSNQVMHRGTCIENEERAIKGIVGKSIELDLTHFDVEELKEFTITIRGDTILSYQADEQVFTLGRKSLINGELETRSHPIGSLENLRIFLDTSSIEIFINHGRDVFTARFFPDPDDESIVFNAKGRIKFDIEKWNIGKITE